MCRGSVRIGILRHLTIRSSRPHVVASAACFALRLHASAAPPRVGLTQALGGRKAFCNCVARNRDSLASVGTALRLVLQRVASSVASYGAHTLHMRGACRLRKRCLVSVSVPLLMLSFLTGPAESSRVRARAFPLRLSASAPGCDLHRHPPPPNNSFKPTPCRGVSRVLLRYACTRLPPRHGAA